MGQTLSQMMLKHLGEINNKLVTHFSFSLFLTNCFNVSLKFFYSSLLSSMILIIHTWALTVKWHMRIYPPSHPQSLMTFLSPTVKCLLFSSQRDWEVKCPGLLLVRDSLSAGSAALPLAVYKGTEVSRRDFWCAPVLSGPLQNREEQTQWGHGQVTFLPADYRTSLHKCKIFLTTCTLWETCQCGRY